MTERLPILEVRDGLVICGGVHRTAPLHRDPDKPPPAVGETHQMLRPVFHLGELARPPVGEIRAGDIIERDDQGNLTHVPRPGTGPVSQ